MKFFVVIHRLVRVSENRTKGETVTSGEKIELEEALSFIAKHGSKEGVLSISLTEYTPEEYLQPDRFVPLSVSNGFRRLI